MCTKCIFYQMVTWYSELKLRPVYMHGSFKPLLCKVSHNYALMATLGDSTKTLPSQRGQQSFKLG